jgi:hypothetical protein
MPGINAVPSRSVWRSIVNKPLRGMLLSIAWLMTLVVPAFAETSAEEAIQRYRLGDPAMFAFLAGNLNGLIWANAELKSSEHAKLFCVPSDVDLSVQRAVDVVTKHLKETAADAARPVGSVMLQGLKETFPCN